MACSGRCVPEFLTLRLKLTSGPHAAHRFQDWRTRVRRSLSQARDPDGRHRRQVSSLLLYTSW